MHTCAELACCIFILLLQESGCGILFWMNPHPLRSCPFPSFTVAFFDFLPFNLLLVRSHQAEIIIEKRLIQGRNKVCDKGGS